MSTVHAGASGMAGNHGCARESPRLHVPEHAVREGMSRALHWCTQNDAVLKCVCTTCRHGASKLSKKLTFLLVKHGLGVL